MASDNGQRTTDNGQRTMQLGRVIGTATATVKHSTFQSERMLVVQLETAAGRPDGEPSWLSTGWVRVAAIW